MNTCTFEVPIPDWVNWIVQDADGEWYGWEDEPHPVNEVWHCRHGMSTFIAHGIPPKNWKEEIYTYK